VPDPNLEQLAARYWAARDYQRIVTTLEQLQAAAIEAGVPERRAALADAVRHFLTIERLNLLLLDFIGGALPSSLAMRLWNLVPDEVIWPILLDAWTRLPDGDNRAVVLDALRERFAANGNRPLPDELRRLLR
jgi:hypothetical protein